MTHQLREDITYDAIIVGGGLAGLTTAYMLRDKNILVLEKEARFGGRVLSEQVDGLTNNIGTQFFSDCDNSMVQMFDELGIQRSTPNPKAATFALNLNNQYYPDGLSYITPKVVFQGLKLLFRSYRKYKIFQLPINDPRWQQLVKGNNKELQDGCGDEFLSLLNVFLRGACLSKPERTSAGIGASFVGSVLDSGQIAFVDGGFQQITDRLADSVADQLVSGATVTEVKESDDLVRVRYQYQGADYEVKARAAAIAAPSPLVADLMPDLPQKKRTALARVQYGPITVVSLTLKKPVPWQRFFGLLSDNTIFQGAFDQTMGSDADKDPEKPILLNLLITHYPDETDEIADFMAKSDDEIIAITLNDVKNTVPHAQTIDDCIIDSKVTRYPIGEVELSPEYYSDLLPELQKSVGNIHFCGDYTEPMSFIDGTVTSGFRVARALGSQLVVSEQEERKTPNHPNYGFWGSVAIALTLMLIVFGLFTVGAMGTTAAISGCALLVSTLLFPIYFPPFKQVYQLIAGVSGTLAVVLGWLLV